MSRCTYTEQVCLTENAHRATSTLNLIPWKVITNAIICKLNNSKIIYLNMQNQLMRGVG